MGGRKKGKGAEKMRMQKRWRPEMGKKGGAEKKEILKKREGLNKTWIVAR